MKSTFFTSRSTSRGGREATPNRHLLRKAVVGETVLHQGCEGDHCGAHQEEVGDAWKMGKTRK